MSLFSTGVVPFCNRRALSEVSNLALFPVVLLALEHLLLSVFLIRALLVCVKLRLPIDDALSPWHCTGLFSGPIALPFSEHANCNYTSGSVLSVPSSACIMPLTFIPRSMFLGAFHCRQRCTFPGSPAPMLSKNLRGR